MPKHASERLGGLDVAGQSLPPPPPAPSPPLVCAAENLRQLQMSRCLCSALALQFSTHAPAACNLCVLQGGAG